LHDMYSAVTDPIKSAALTSQATIDLLHTINFAGYSPAGGAVYPGNYFGQSLKSTAALIKADVGVEAVAVDILGWDTHGNQGPFNGNGDLFNLMTTLAGGLSAFHADMFSGNGRNVTVVVMSEFGRRLAENTSLGTDHGHANAMFIMGNNIAGGRVLRDWPGLAVGQLYQGIDLQVTIDYRDVLAEIVQKRLGNGDLSTVFPNYFPTFRGVTTDCFGSGDLNCDGKTDAADIAPFVQGVTNPGSFTGCNIRNGDLNADGLLTIDDVQPFANKLIGN
jgi:uncharacterized protein (DUF1501 family)